MAQCIRCGKKGLFLKVNKHGVCDACVAAYNEKVEAMKREHEEQERHYAEEYAIAQKYESANSLPPSERIAAYEALIRQYPDYEGINSRIKQLAVFCRLEKQYDKAWGLLNQVIMLDMKSQDHIGINPSIRYEQFLVLKEDGKNLQAVEYLGCFYVLRKECPPSFYKTIRPLTNKEGLSKEQTEAIVALVQQFITEENTNESEFVAAYRALIRQYR